MVLGSASLASPLLRDRAYPATCLEAMLSSWYMKLRGCGSASVLSRACARGCSRITSQSATCLRWQCLQSGSTPLPLRILALRRLRPWAPSLMETPSSHGPLSTLRAARHALALAPAAVTQAVTQACLSAGRLALRARVSHGSSRSRLPLLMSNVLSSVRVRHSSADLSANAAAPVAWHLSASLPHRPHWPLRGRRRPCPRVKAGRRHRGCQPRSASTLRR